MVGEIETNGHDSSEANRFLYILLDTYKLFEQFRANILRELNRTEL